MYARRKAGQEAGLPRQAGHVAGLLASVGQLQVGGLLAGHQADGAFELGYGVRGPPEGQKAAAREQSCGTKRRIEPRGRAKFRERLDVAIPLLMDDPEVVMDECPVTAASQHIAK